MELMCRDHYLGKENQGYREIDEITRLYYAVRDNGFEFLALSITGSLASCKDVWSDLVHTTVDVIYHGSAYFDGVRHLYMNMNDDLGYIYYPCLETQIEILKALRELELKYCDLN